MPSKVTPFFVQEYDKYVRLCTLCLCGCFGDSLKPCTCTPMVLIKYQKRISGPLLDSIDIHIEVPRVDYEKLSGNKVNESSDSIRQRVQAARDIQNKRFTNGKTTDIVSNVAGSENIQSVHLAEALQYRPKIMMGK